MDEIAQKGLKILKKGGQIKYKLTKFKNYLELCSNSLEIPQLKRVLVKFGEKKHNIQSQIRLFDELA